MRKLNLFLSVLVILFMNSCIPIENDLSLEGDWSCKETSTIFLKSTNQIKGTSIFPVYIAVDQLNGNKYYIDNIYQLGTGNQGTITVSGTAVTLSSQIINGIEFSGAGTVSSDYNTMTLTYSADDGGGEIDQVTAEYTR